jgi:hypothetical protein
MKFNIFWQITGNFSFLMLFVAVCSSELNINVIHEVFDVPNGQKGTFFGASLAMNQGLYSGAPYHKSKTGVFKCSSGRNTCDRDKSFSLLGK